MRYREEVYSPDRALLFTVSDSEIAGGGIALGVAVGVALGAGVGAAIDNMGLGIGIGLALGVAIGVAWDQQDA